MAARARSMMVAEAMARLIREDAIGQLRRRNGAMARLGSEDGALIDRVGYHVRDYFLGQWERYRDMPGMILAHSTHVQARERTMW